MNAPRGRRSSAKVRFANAALYALFAALSIALLARPAALWLRGLGLTAPALPWRVPLGGPCALLIALLAAFTLRFALSLASEARPRVAEHVAFLLCVAVALLLRSLAGAPQPPASPAPALEAGLSACAEALERAYAAQGSYPENAAPLDAALSALPAPGFRLRGRPLPLQVALLAGATGPRLSGAREAKPGTIFVALSADRQRAWLTAVDLRAGAAAILLRAGAPLVLQTRGGTHGPPGQGLLPTYPGAQRVAQPALPRSPVAP